MTSPIDTDSAADGIALRLPPSGTSRFAHLQRAFHQRRALGGCPAERSASRQAEPTQRERPANSQERQELVNNCDENRAQPQPAEPILCPHCLRTASNGIKCKGICVADSDY